MNSYTKLARESIEYYLGHKDYLKTPDDLPDNFQSGKAGVFVTLHTRQGELRGCIGTFLPTQESIAKEIIENAVSAATHDPRFPPVTKRELSNLSIEVSILEKPEPVKSKKDLDPQNYGVIVRTNDGRSGLLLPGIQSLNTVDEQLNIVAQKGGIDLGHDTYSLARFKTTVYKDDN